MGAKREPAPANQRRDLITKFLDEYTDALAEARISAAHTETEGWKRLYAGRREEEEKGRQAIAKELHELADIVERRLLTEDEEKRVGDLKKSAAELRDRSIVFNLQTVDKVRAPVQECDRIIDLFAHEAYRDEQRAPLVNTGLEELMKMTVRQQPRPRWDADAGLVVIEPPKE